MARQWLKPWSKSNSRAWQATSSELDILLRCSYVCSIRSLYIQHSSHFSLFFHWQGWRFVWRHSCTTRHKYAISAYLHPVRVIPASTSHVISPISQSDFRTSATSGLSRFTDFVYKRLGGLGESIGKICFARLRKGKAVALSTEGRMLLEKQRGKTTRHENSKQKRPRPLTEVRNSQR